MENLTEKQAQNHLRKIAKNLGLKLKFETLDFGMHCEVSDTQSVLSAGSVYANTSEVKDFTGRLQEFLVNSDVQALRKKFKIHGLKP